MYEFCYLWAAGTDAVSKSNANSCSKSLGNSEGSQCDTSEPEAKDMDDGDALNPKGNFFFHLCLCTRIIRTLVGQQISVDLCKNLQYPIDPAPREELFHLQDIQGAEAVGDPFS